MMKRTWSRRSLAVPASIALLLAAAAGLATKGNATTQVRPVNQSPPTISGTPAEGQTLTASNGTWTGTQPITYAYSWRRCDATGGSCSAIGGANQRTYVLKRPDVGNTVRVRVTARNRDGSASATSVPSAVIGAAPRPGSCAGNAPLQAASIAPPERLSLNQGQITPSPVGRSTQSVTVRFQVTCAGKAVQGALVYATAVPFNQFTIPAEQTTGADGYAQLTMTRQSGFPAARRQQLLVVFTRARKPGENALGGISTRRLVSFRVDLSR
jgi:hypothetical protein